MPPSLLLHSRKRLDRRGGTDKEHWGCGERTEHDRRVSGVKSRGSIGLIGRLMLFINDDQPDFPAQCAECYARTHDEVRSALR